MKEASGDCSETELKSVLTLPYEFTRHSFSPIKLLQKKVWICIAPAAYRFNPQFHGVEAGGRPAPLVAFVDGGVTV